MSLLLPPGISGLADCPFTLHEAILQAFMFISFDELSLEDRPPRKIWLVKDEMEAWWEERDRIRDEKLKDPSGGVREDGPYEENDAMSDMVDRG